MISTKEAAQQMQALGELFLTVAPHIEEMSSLQERKAAMEARCAQLDAHLRDVTETARARKEEAVALAEQIRNEATEHKAGVEATLEQRVNATASRIAAMEAHSKEQMDSFSADLERVQAEIREHRQHRDALVAEIAKHKAALAESVAAL